MYGRKIFRPYVRQQYPFTQPSPFPHHKSWQPPNVTTRRMCRGEIFFARTCAIDAQSPNHQTSPHHKSWRIPDVTIHRICTGEKYFARACAIDAQSPNHQTPPHHKSWRTANLTTRRICRGEIFFARTCAIDAQSPTRCDRVAAVRRRTMDVRAEYFSPGRARLTRHRSHIGRQRATLRANDCVFCRRAICWWRGRA